MGQLSAQPQCVGGGETPGRLTRLARNPPSARGLQSVVPASDGAPTTPPPAAGVEERDPKGTPPRDTRALAQVHDPQPSGPARGFKGTLKKSEFRAFVAWARGCVEGEPGERAGRGDARAHTGGGGRERTPGPVAHKTPQGLAMSPPRLRLSGASSRSPQPRNPPLPGPSAPFIFLDSAWGFAGFWEIKNRLK
ncbi:hypothetical protein I79_014824 [Cricetulus griseus]|uniref:Uncharacterized protein n=1 Tax=Cricetulus griseus TaxID=10029 RepID=G3HV47_CRIGR|nr:hypothetical protein I79_014824 [Cricetulus griseus]